MIIDLKPPLVQDTGQRQFQLRTIMLPDTIVQLLKSLNVVQFILLYTLSLRGEGEASDLTPILGCHQSTTYKNLKVFKETDRILVSRIKPGTEKKRHPGQIYSLVPEVTPELIKSAAQERGIDIEVIYQQRVESLRDTEQQPEAGSEVEEDKASKKKTEPEANQETEEMPNATQDLSDSKSTDKDSAQAQSPQPPGGLPPFDPSWSDEMKSDWFKIYRGLVGK